MARLKLDRFGGMLPAWDDRLLPQQQAAYSRDAYLFSGGLIGWRKPTLLRALTDSAAKFAYRIPIVSKSVATAYLAFITNVNEGDTVKLGEETYTFKNELENPYDVKLGALASESAANFFAAITGAEGGSNVQYGTGTFSNTVIDTEDSTNTNHDFGSGEVPVITVKATDYGEAYNITPVTESSSGTRVTWLYDLNLAHTTTTLLGGTNASFDGSIGSSSYWLEFADPDTNVIRSPVVNDQYQRYYFASPSQPPKYNTYDRIANGDGAWLLGVPAPGCQPTVSVAGGGSSATLGNDVVEDGQGAAETILANHVVYVPVTTDGQMALTSIKLMPSSDNNTAVSICALYDDVGGQPGTFLNKTPGRIGQLTADTETEYVFANPTVLEADTQYWLAFGAQENIAAYIAKADNNAFIQANTMANGFPEEASGLTEYYGIQMWGEFETNVVHTARAYVYTWVSEYGEEGPPSPPTLVNGWQNGVWTIGVYSPSADEMGVTRNLTKTRIYRTISGVQGDTTYFFVTEMDITTESYVDTEDDDLTALNNTILTTNWYPPPEGLLGIVSMPNGVFAGFKGNEIWFSEPYSPHAWPPDYVLTTEFPVVGLGVLSNGVVAVTAGTPYVSIGTSPATMNLVKVEVPEPCNSRGSVVSVDNGVMYTSPNGLILVTPFGSASNVTEAWLTREKWSLHTPPKYVRAVKMLSQYFAFGSVVDGDDTYAQQGFTIDMTTTDREKMRAWPQPGDHRVGFNIMVGPNGYDIDNFYLDPWSGVALIVQNGQIYQYDFTDQSPEIVPYKWKSKVFQLNAKRNLEVMKFFFSVPPGTPTQSATRNTAAVQTLAADQYGIVRVYADGTLVTTREIRTSGEVLRITSGFKADFWQFEIEGRVDISNMQTATSLKELSEV